MMASLLSIQEIEAPNVVEHVEASDKSLSQAHCVATCVNEQAVRYQSCRYFWDASPEGQLARLLNVVAVTTVTPIEARENLEIDRLHEHIETLRQDGHNIQANFYWMVGAGGERSCSVQYALHEGAYQPWDASKGGV
jgi:hypothetical protein